MTILPKLWHPVDRPAGTWETCYWINDQFIPAENNATNYAHAAHGRCLPAEWQIYADPTGHGVNVFSNPAPGELGITPVTVSGTGTAFNSPYDSSTNPVVLAPTPYTRASGVLCSRRTFEHQYGIYEAEVIFPSGFIGAFCAFWLKNQTDNKEIDIAENLSKRPREILFNILNSGSVFGTVISGQSLVTMPATWDPTVYHKYSCEWRQGFVAFKIDDIEYYRIQPYTSGSNVLTSVQGIIFDYAMRRDWNDTGAPDAAIIGQSMYVRNLRVRA